MDVTKENSRWCILEINLEVTSCDPHITETIITPEWRNGDTISFFPRNNPDKADAYWNFPLTIEKLPNIIDPNIIGSILVPRVRIDGTRHQDGSLSKPDKILSEPRTTPLPTHIETVKDCEKYLGIGVQRLGGKNSGDVFSSIFQSDEFYWDSTHTSTTFGEIDTWNYGDNSVQKFVPTFLSVIVSQLSTSQANAYKVQPPFNQAVDRYSTYGVFMNCMDTGINVPLMSIEVYDVTDELPNLVKDHVYSSYRKGVDLTSKVQPPLLESEITTTDNTRIYVEENGVVLDTQGNVISDVQDMDAYNGKYYYFGMWVGVNALYDIETNYNVR